MKVEFSQNGLGDQTFLTVVKCTEDPSIEPRKFKPFKNQRELLHPAVAVDTFEGGDLSGPKKEPLDSDDFHQVEGT